MKRSMSGVRGASLAALVAVPALAVAFLGLGGFDLPRFQVNETRQFNANGQQMTQPTTTETEQPVEIFLNNWQNTVRTPPSPRI
jgi:hypothetical protein